MSTDIIDYNFSDLDLELSSFDGGDIIFDVAIHFGEASFSLSRLDAIVIANDFNLTAEDLS